MKRFVASLVLTLALQTAVSEPSPTVTPAPTSTAVPTATVAPTVSYAPTVNPTSPVCVPKTCPANETQRTCAPVKNYCNYNKSAKQINRAVKKDFIDMLWPLGVLVVGALIVTFLGPFFFWLVKPLRLDLDKLQVAVVTKARLDSIAGFSRMVIAFTSFVDSQRQVNQCVGAVFVFQHDRALKCFPAQVIATRAISDRSKTKAFQEYNLQYVTGFLFLMFAFVFFLFIYVVASGLADQIKGGFITRLTVVLTWFLDIMNVFGIICFIHATMEFQETFGWTRSFRDVPRGLGNVFIGCYVAYWLVSHLLTVNILNEWRVIRNSGTSPPKEILMVPGGLKPNWGPCDNCTCYKKCIMCLYNWLITLLHNWLSQDEDIFEHFNVKPIGKAKGSLANPTYTISVEKGDSTSVPKSGEGSERA